MPRITELEEEVRLLRKVCWPVCQRLTEKHALGDIESKREFLERLDDEEVWMLLRRKSTGSVPVTQEYIAIKNVSSSNP